MRIRDWSSDVCSSDLAATGRGISIPAVSDFDAPTGRGAIGTVDNRRVTLGNARIMRESGIDLAAMEAAADELRRRSEARRAGIECDCSFRSRCSPYH